MVAKCVKLSKSGKTMLVAAKTSKYSVGFEFGWASNPDNLAVGAEVIDFKPTGRVSVSDEEGEPVLHEDGSPVQRWIF